VGPRRKGDREAIVKPPRWRTEIVGEGGEPTLYVTIQKVGGAHTKSGVSVGVSPHRQIG